MGGVILLNVSNWWIPAAGKEAFLVVVLEAMAT